MLKEFSHEQKSEYMSYITDHTKHIVWYGGDSRDIYLKWVKSVWGTKEDIIGREFLAAEAEKINADFIVHAWVVLQAHEFKDQKSKMLFLLKYS
jgi:hypothetical protein